MNQQQYEMAATRLLDREFPDAHLEVMLVCGPEPSEYYSMEDLPEWIDWSNAVERFMFDRMGYTPGSNLTTVVRRIIARRMHSEQQKARSG